MSHKATKSKGHQTDFLHSLYLLLLSPYILTPLLVVVVKFLPLRHDLDDLEFVVEAPRFDHIALHRGRLEGVAENTRKHLKE